MSVVNYKMAESCRHWRADHASDTLQNAKISDLRSVKITKFRPSKKYRKCRTDKCIEKNSRSNALYLVSAGHNFLLKNARGLLQRTGDTINSIMMLFT